ncbi:MAG: PilZ domain-containing protein, partial [Pseudomonas sp.]|nr:PilZ domain-containing protein [Pseudomonas sp.]
MSKKSLLNNEELNYIQQVFGNNLAIAGLPTPSFRVDGGAAANAILTDLGKHAELHLDAQLGDQHLRFPLHLVEDEFHILHLELGAPSIFQQGDVQRSWRLNLEQPLCLLHKNGRMSDL